MWLVITITALLIVGLTSYVMNRSVRPGERQHPADMSREDQITALRHQQGGDALRGGREVPSAPRSNGSYFGGGGW